MKNSCAPTEVSAESCGIGAPLTVKLVPGRDSNEELREGLLTQSRAQASLARRISGKLFNAVRSSKRAPRADLPFKFIPE